MIPRSSSIGYLDIDGVLFPITSIEILEGKIWFQCEAMNDDAEPIVIDGNSDWTLIGADGSQAMWASRRRSDRKTHKIRRGHYVTVNVDLTIDKITDDEGQG